MDDAHGDKLLAMVQARPEDLESRAVLGDYLLERGHPGARFLKLDRELSTTPRADSRYAELTEALAEVVAGLDPTWILSVGELDAARWDVVAESTFFLVGVLQAAGIPFARDDVGATFERGLRRADAQFLVSSDSRLRLAPNQRVTALARLRHLLLRPYQWVIGQPRFNTAWPLRGEPDQRTPPMNGEEAVDLVLLHAGPKKNQTMKVIRELFGLSLRETKALVEVGGVISKRSAQGAEGDWSPVGPALPGRVPLIAEGMSKRSASSAAHQLRLVSAEVVLVGPEYDALRFGEDDREAELRATARELTFGPVRWRWLSSHEAETVIDPRLSIPLDEVFSRSEEIAATLRLRQ